ncbi:hypothetical protein MEO40_17840 [Dolichospermum sp. ST_sed1]|nr:hypothetical protein [Dolichospermum sp. ST_sed1]
MTIASIRGYLHSKKNAGCMRLFQLPITNYQLPITNYQLPITNYQLPINYE